MKEIIQLKGTNGVIHLYDDRIIISRNTFGGIVSFGIVGDKTFFYNAIQGVEFSGGLLRIIPKGCDASNYSIMNICKAQKDSNVILLSPSKVKKAKQICEIISQKVNETCLNKNNEISSVADEILKFKKLLDEGIITKSEFERKKQELLN